MLKMQLYVEIFAADDVVVFGAAKVYAKTVFPRRACFAAMIFAKAPPLECPVIQNMFRLGIVQY